MGEQRDVGKKYMIRFVLTLKNGETRYTKPENLNVYAGEGDYIEPAVLRAIDELLGSEYTLCVDPADSERKDRVVSNSFVAEFIPYVFDVEESDDSDDEPLVSDD